ncbi:hypothetical protein RINTHM_3470 [Richelia intracellularis HM01]|uniref:hypothetical protein n=1 Tax=Richelia intracellularis TaxID=1164990 RepID=UPI0002B4E7A6|nr:hypothetical protein [Richelia intracellularis]CCH64821.1 hypothetical protein RINTHM_3470 [Richelia intracellularis HM01]
MTRGLITGNITSKLKLPEFILKAPKISPRPVSKPDYAWAKFNNAKMPYAWQNNSLS